MWHLSKHAPSWLPEVISGSHSKYLEHKGIWVTRDNRILLFHTGERALPVCNIDPYHVGGTECGNGFYLTINPQAAITMWRDVHNQRVPGRCDCVSVYAWNSDTAPTIRQQASPFIRASGGASLLIITVLHRHAGASVLLYS